MSALDEFIFLTAVSRETPNPDDMRRIGELRREMPEAMRALADRCDLFLTSIDARITSSELLSIMDLISASLRKSLP